MPRYAVCIPNYNRLSTIVECVASIVDQNDPDFEVIVQDDCSTDGSSEVLFSQFGDRISIRKNSSNLGFGGNLSRCLSYASDYEWVGILHSDDRHEKGSLAAFKAEFGTGESIGIVFSPTHDIDSEGHYIRRAASERILLRRGDDGILRTGGVLPYSTIFYRNVALIQAGVYDPRFSHSGDEEYNARIMQHWDALQIEGVWGCYRRHPGQTMIKSWAKEDFISSYELMKLTINSYLSKKNRHSDSRIRRNVARTLFDHCNGLVANRHFHIVKKFHRHLFRVNPICILSPGVAARYVLQKLPVIGPYLCQKYSKNAAL